jgi:hypothetical protein
LAFEGGLQQIALLTLAILAASYLHFPRINPNADGLLPAFFDGCPGFIIICFLFDYWLIIVFFSGASMVLR